MDLGNFPKSLLAILPESFDDAEFDYYADASIETCPGINTSSEYWEFGARRWVPVRMKDVKYILLRTPKHVYSFEFDDLAKITVYKDGNLLEKVKRETVDALVRYLKSGGEVL